MNNQLNYFYFPGLRYSPDSLLRDTCNIYSNYSRKIKDGYTITPRLLMSKDRRMHVVEARMVFMYIMRCNSCDNLSLETIGAMVNRDHSTVTYAVAEIESRVQWNRLLIPLVEFKKLSNKKVYDAKMFINIYEPEQSTV